MNELLEISLAMKEELKARIGSPQSSFDLWFGDFNLISLDESRAVFSTPTKLRRQILSTRYISLIKEALAEVIGFAVEIEIYSLDEDSSFSTPAAPSEDMSHLVKPNLLLKITRIYHRFFFSAAKLRTNERNIKHVSIFLLKYVLMIEIQIHYYLPIKN